jgi:hypothetical protein
MEKRPSPSESATKFKIGKIATGNDGNKWIVVANKNGVKRWKKKTAPKILGKVYLIHDNGGRPFKVIVTPIQCIVYGGKYDKELKESYDEIVLTLKKYKKIFIGQDPKISSFKGNSILVQMTEEKYVFIGMEIYEFTVPKNDPILYYRSPVGNSDVPYPYAIAAEKTYLMIENAVIKTNDFSGDPYVCYYGFHKKGKKCIGTKLKKKILVKRNW